MDPTSSLSWDDSSLRRSLRSPPEANGPTRWACWSIHVFVEAAPRGLDPQQVRAVIQDVDGVVDVHHLHLWSLASDVPACSAHVVLADQPTLAEAQHSGMAIKAALADQFALTRVTLELEDIPAAPRIPDVTFVDPAVTRAGRTSG